MECELDGLHDAIEVSGDVGVPESQSAEAASSKDRVAHGVVLDLALIISVLAPINFDDEAMLEAHEIEIESKQRGLATEMEAVSLHHPELHPKTRFLRG